MKPIRKQQAVATPPRARPAAASLVVGADLAELVHDLATGRTRFAVSDGAAWRFEDEVVDAAGERRRPYPGANAILKHGVVLFPSEPAEYGATADLVAEVEAYIHRYVDLSPAFERLAAWYVLFTWLSDRFNEVPYLRLQGDYGTGKTRFLLVVGSICRSPIFAGGASTPSPLFHMLDEFAGTLLIDEADFRFSDEKAQIAKILNAGNVRGVPILRAEAANGHEFRPRPYQVFGPKIIAMRGEFDDRALESRFITERSDGRALRGDVPLNLPKAQAAEALLLRNKLLLYRFRRYAHVGEVSELVDPALEPRINQIFSPLLSIIEDSQARADVRAAARERQQAIDDDRGTSVEAELLTALRYLIEHGGERYVTVGEIAALYAAAFGRADDRSVTSRWAGHVLRRKLGIATRRSNGNFVIVADPGKLALLYDRYRISAEDAARLAAFDRSAQLTRVVPVDFGDVGDIGEVAA